MHAVIVPNLKEADELTDKYTVSAINCQSVMYLAVS